MKAIMLMFDSLNRRFLSPYGCDWVKTPNFERLAAHAVRFDNCYVGSLPCMPARRELHTGRYNFFHRCWGPLEPFDDSMPEILKKNGVYTHLITDHFHYWEDGGATYHNRYSTWEGVRGQEIDHWKASVDEPERPEESPLRRMSSSARNFWANKPYQQREADYPLARTIALAEEYLDKNHAADDWFLQVECFDPHEPFVVPARYQALYPDAYTGAVLDWPAYRPLNEGDTPEARAHVRMLYAALVTMCDAYLGRVLDKMDRYDLWKDTLLIVNTDHGFLLGEHDWWGKNAGPTYNELANIPLFIWDPRVRAAGESRSALVQTIDIAPTLYGFFGIEKPADVLGRDIAPALQSDASIRDHAAYGLHGASVNITDGRYALLCAPEPNDGEVFNYTLMCTHASQRFSAEEMRTAELAAPFSFTKGSRVLKVRNLKKRALDMPDALNPRSLLFDLRNDPGMEHPLENPAAEKRMRAMLSAVMIENDAPPEVYARYRIPLPGGAASGRAEEKY